MTKVEHGPKVVLSAEESLKFVEDGKKILMAHFEAGEIEEEDVLRGLVGLECGDNGEEVVILNSDVREDLFVEMMKFLEEHNLPMETLTNIWSEQYEDPEEQPK